MIVTAFRGLGSGSQIVGTVGGSTAAIAGSIFSSTALMTALGIAPAFGPVGLAIAGVVAAGAAIASAFGVGSGCGPTCVQATQIVNQAEPLFKQNVEAYQNGQIPQSVAIDNYNQLKTAVAQSCGAIPGDAGKNCYDDRFTNPCKWKDSAGQCWNWEIGYYQPLLVSNGTSSAGSSISNLITNSNSSLLIAGVAGAIGLVMAMGD